MGRIIGDFRDYEEKVLIGDMDQEEYQKIFENARYHGLDDSVYPFAVGGSDVATIFGINPFSTPLKLKKIKKGEYVEPISEEKELMFYKGHVFEGPFRDLFSKITGYKTYPYYKQTVHDEYEHCVANIDGLCVIDRELWIYEGKTTQNYSYKSQFLKGHVPPSYHLQVQFYMEVLDELSIETLEEVDPALPSMLDDYKIKGAVVNCGWGIEADEMKWVYVERNETLGNDICDLCESWVLDIASGKNPSNENVIDVNILKKDEYANYGDIDKNVPPIEINNEFLEPIKKAIEIDTSIKKLDKIMEEKSKEEKKLKEKYSEAEKTLKELQKKKEELLYPLIEEFKSGTKGYIKIGDETYNVIYDGETKYSLDKTVKKYWEEKYPECFKDVTSYKKTNKREFVIVKEEV